MATNGEWYMNQSPVLHFNSSDIKDFPFWQSNKVVKIKKIGPKKPLDTIGKQILKIIIAHIKVNLFFLIWYINIINIITNRKIKNGIIFINKKYIVWFDFKKSVKWIYLKSLSISFIKLSWFQIG